MPESILRVCLQRASLTELEFAYTHTHIDGIQPPKRDLHGILNAGITPHAVPVLRPTAERVVGAESQRHAGEGGGEKTSRVGGTATHFFESRGVWSRS